MVDGIVFDSKAEAKRYGELNLLQQAGEIGGLTLRPKFPMVVAGMKICTYIGDFLYSSDGLQVCEDVKGVRTPAYVIKRKLFLALYPQHRHVEIRAK